MTPLTSRLTLLLVISAFGFAACGEPVEEPREEEVPVEDNGEDIPPLSDLDDVIGDHPEENGQVLDRLDQKFDITLPAKFDLVETQSPVRNQAGRGVCSIFSTVGLMEHLYIKAGEPMPDFSEQYLQWSAKVEVGAFPRTSGSSGKSNLEAIVKHGIVTEADWPYVGKKWTTSDHEACTGEDSQPTLCYTHDSPPASALAAKKYTLPRQQAITSFPDSIKTHMFKNQTAVVSGMTFFYQAWSHGGSKLGINQENKAAGAVVFPSSKDQELSLVSRAGHSILLVGWDDTIEFARLDEKGKPLTDEDGNVIMDKGFFLFKNSWGTGGSWGKDNPFGKGYGWLSYRYVQRWGRSVSATVPDLTKDLVEICGDNADNDRNGLSDCEDAACSGEAMCQNNTRVETFKSQDGPIMIPDNDTTGITSAINVAAEGSVKSLSVTVDITHSWSGDVSILVMAPSGEFAVLRESNTNSGDDIKETFTTNVLNNEDVNGEWLLMVDDGSKFDTGTLNGWSMNVTL